MRDIFGADTVVEPQETRKGNQLRQVGKRLPIRDASLKATGQKIYTSDLERPGMLVGKLLFSREAHAVIKNIDVSRAEALPGVEAVLTWENTPRIPFNSANRFMDDSSIKAEYVFDNRVRYIGDRVAAVAARDLKTAEAALKLIDVEYEKLPCVFDPEEAMKPDSPILHPGLLEKGNSIIEIKAETGDIREGFKNADHIFEDRYTTQPVHHGAIERHAAMADFDSRGKLTVWSPCQNTFAFRIILAGIMELPLNRVRLINPAIGGGFGGKLESVLEPVASLLSRMTGKPVKIELSRSECIVSTKTRHAAVVYLKTGVNNDGTIIAQDIRVVTNTGAYPGSGINVIGAMSHRIFKIYKTSNVRFTGVPVMTNTPVGGAMRGYGSPQLLYPHQAQLNRIARELDLDPLTLQLKNLVEPGDHDLSTGSPIGNPRPLDCVIRGAEAFGWNRKFNKNGKISDDGRYIRGTGMAVGSHGNGVFGAHSDYTSLMLKMNEDGTAVLVTGVNEMGNGAVTAQTMIISEVLGLDPEDIECVEADTDAVLWDIGAYSSRGVYVAGRAAEKAALAVKYRILAESSELLGISQGNLEMEDGWIFSKENRTVGISLKDLLLHVQKVKQGELAAVETFSSRRDASSYGAHFTEVQVDRTNGEVKVSDYLAIHDIGRAINPLAVEGQIEGAVAIGIGYALWEDLGLDDQGNTMNRNLKKYRLMKASQMPDVKIILIEEGEKEGPFGGKSIGECSIVPSAPAVANAVCNAIGVDFHSLPLTQDKILKIIQKRSQL